MKTIFLIFVLLGTVSTVRPQTDSAGTKPGPKAIKSPTGKSVKKPTTKPPPKPKPQPKPKPVAPVNAKLIITISEPESEIFLTSKSGNALGESESVFTGADGAPYSVENLRTGSYTVIVKKPGFIDFRVQIEITGKAAAVNVPLVPAVAYLSITCAGLPDAVIEIVGVGRFTGAVERRPLKPGIYSVNISRKGYLPTNESINIPAHGAEVSKIIVLQPVPVSSLIAEAETAFAARDFARADTILRDVIEIEPENGKANLLLGLSVNERDESGAAAFLIKALRAGESIALDVHVYTDDKRMLQAKLSLDRTYLKIEVPGTPNLNCHIFKQDFRSIEQKVDKQNLRFSLISGNGDNSKNKKTDRKISVYPKYVFLKNKDKDTFCQQGAGGQLRCDAASINIFDLIYGWQTQLR